MSSKDQALTPAKEADNKFKLLMVGALPSIRQVAGKYIDPERLVKIALVARSKTPGLQKCTPQSILMAVMNAAETGLEPNTPLQHAALVPRYNSKTKTFEAHFEPMWRGMVAMARRSCGLKSCRARLVYDTDKWSIEEGVARDLKHTPNLEAQDRGKVVLVYSVAEMDDGTVEWDYMTLKQIEKIREQYSKAKDSGPWVDSWDEMAKKTVVKRLMKSLPITDDVARVIEADDGAPSIIDVDFVDLPEAESEDRSTAVADKINKKNGNGNGKHGGGTKKE